MALTAEDKIDIKDAFTSVSCHAEVPGFACYECPMSGKIKDGYGCGGAHILYMPEDILLSRLNNASKVSIQALSDSGFTLVQSLLQSTILE